MDQETISRKEKIELARKQTEWDDFQYRRPSGAYTKNSLQERENGNNGYFFLRVLLSSFLFFAVLGVTKFQAMGEKQAQEYQTKLVKVLKEQNGVEHMKELLKSIGSIRSVDK